jgi:Tol biopolymer transport system component
MNINIHPKEATIMKRTHCFVLAIALLAAILTGCERDMNLVTEPAANAGAINELSLMKGGNSIIAFQSDRTGDKEIYVMYPDGSGPIRITYRDGHDGYPDISPDGKKIAFERQFDDGNLEIYVMNLDGTDQTRVTNSPAMDGDPDWSPNGKTILFGRMNDGASEICTINPDGSGFNVLYNSGSTYFSTPVWSPNGKKIAFQGNAEGNFEIYVMNANGTGVTNLTNNAASDAYASWSPDGRKIAFISNRDGNYEVYVMNADGSGQTRLTNSPGREYNNPAWSPDGKQIVFDSNRDGNYEIYVMNADGSGQTNISNNFDATDYAPDWGNGSLNQIDQNLIRDIEFSTEGFTARVFYDNIYTPDGLAWIADKKLFVVRESNWEVGSGVFRANEGTEFSVDDAFSTLGPPFDGPDGLVLGEGNILYVSDGQTETVYKLPHEGGAPVPFVTSTTANTSLNPYGLAIAPANFDGPNVDPGDLLIADNSYGNESRGVRAVNPTTGVVKVLAEGGVFEDGPLYLAFSSDGTLFAFENMGVESHPRRIVTVSADGIVTPFLTGITSPSTFAGGMAIHPKTDEIFFEQNQTEIWRIPRSGGTPQLFASNVGAFQSMTFNKSGSTLYVSCVGRNQVIEISAQPNVW